MKGRWREAKIARTSRITSRTSSGRHVIQGALVGPAIGKSGWIVARKRGVAMISIPGPGSGRNWLAKSMSACDTARMTALSRALARWDPIRVAAAALGLAMLLLVAAYGVSLTVASFTPGAAVSVVPLFLNMGSSCRRRCRWGAGDWWHSCPDAALEALRWRSAGWESRACTPHFPPSLRGWLLSRVTRAARS